MANVDFGSPTSDLAVIRIKDVWRVLDGPRRLGAYEYQVDAVEAALRLAEQARAAGRDRRVLVQSLTGEIRPA